jgi:hypothetical protein
MLVIDGMGEMTLVSPMSYFCSLLSQELGHIILQQRSGLDADPDISYRVIQLEIHVTVHSVNSTPLASLNYLTNLGECCQTACLARCSFQ